MRKFYHLDFALSMLVEANLACEQAGFDLNRSCDKISDMKSYKLEPFIAQSIVKYEDNLNPQQLKVVKEAEKPLLVLAGSEKNQDLN